jgi:hypothetical protein
MATNQNLLNMAKEVRTLQSKYTTIIMAFEKMSSRSRWEDIRDSVAKVLDTLNNVDDEIDQLVETILEKANTPENK